MAYVHMPNATDMEGMLGGSGTQHVWIRSVGGGEGHFLGELVLVRSFVRWAARHQTFDVLDHLLEPDERLADGLAVRMAHTVGRLKSLPDDPAEGAIALVVPEHAGARVRTLVAFEPSVLLASPWGELQVSGGDLTLASKVARAHRTPVRGWRVMRDSGEIDTGNDQVAVSDPGLLQLLRAAGRGAEHVEARVLSARAAFAPLLLALGDGLADVIHQHGDMVVSRTAR